jgi:hypothetical protein
MAMSRILSRRPHPGDIAGKGLDPDVASGFRLVVVRRKGDP